MHDHLHVHVVEQAGACQNEQSSAEAEDQRVDPVAMIDLWLLSAVDCVALVDRTDALHDGLFSQVQSLLVQHIGKDARDQVEDDDEGALWQYLLVSSIGTEDANHGSHVELKEIEVDVADHRVEEDLLFEVHDL